MGSSSRPSVWLVSPAWGRYPVTRLALAQRAHLAQVLALRGIDCQSVIVADDENLDIARDHGMATVELDNDGGLGRRFNAGYEYAAAEGADWFVHIGSDDWLHPDALLPVLAPPMPFPIFTGRRIAFVDLIGGRMRQATMQGLQGVIPWIIPRRMLERCGFAPIEPERRRGMDGSLIRGLRKARAQVSWVVHDPHAVCRVDFKSTTNLNRYEQMPGNRGTAVDPWEALAAHYPPDLVDLARSTHLELAEGASCRS